MTDSVWNTVSWIDEPVSTDKLNKMVANEEYLHDRMLAGRYTGAGVSTDISTRIISGYAYVPANTKGSSSTVVVNFSGFFSPGCQPVVTTGIYGKTQRYLMAVVTGPTNDIATPDHTGCRIFASAFILGASVAKQRLSACYVGWTAMGY